VLGFLFNFDFVPFSVSSVVKRVAATKDYRRDYCLCHPYEGILILAILKCESGAWEVPTAEGSAYHTLHCRNARKTDLTQQVLKPESAWSRLDPHPSQ